MQACSVCDTCEARAISICGALDPRDLPRMAALAVNQVIPAGAGFIAEGEPAEDFFSITAGTARLFKLLPDGRRQVTGFSTIGAFLGLAVAEEYTFSAEAVEPMRVCRFSRPRLRRLLQDFPCLERKLLDTATNELVAAQDQILLLGRKTARERVASFLLAQAIGDRVRLPMTRTDIADYLGLTIETVSRTLSRFRAERLIGLPSLTAAVLYDRRALERIAGGLE